MKALHINVTLTDTQVARLELARRFLSEDARFGISEDSSLERVFCEMADEGARHIANYLMEKGILDELAAQ